MIYRFKSFSIVLLCLILISCSSNDQPSKEQILSQSITQIENRFEARSMSEIVEFISEDYQDEYGRTLRDIKRIIQIQILRHKTVYIFTSIGDVVWTDDKNVKVQIAAAMAGKPIESASLLTSVRADMINFTVDFVLEDDIYKVKSATWKWARPHDFL